MTKKHTIKQLEKMLKQASIPDQEAVMHLVNNGWEGSEALYEVLVRQCK